MPIDKIRDMIAFAVPVRIIDRPERLIIQDYRPTALMLLAGFGFLVFAGLLAWMLARFGTAVDPAPILVLAFFGVVCLGVAAYFGTIREVYIFDSTTKSYAFVRQFLHRKEIIEGDLGQFTGARVETQTNEDSESYFVVLQQEGMFLTGVSEQTLREATPILNSFEREADIANAIDAFLHRRS